MRPEMPGDAFEIMQAVIGSDQAKTEGIKCLTEVVEQEIKSGNPMSKNDGYFAFDIGVPR
jgi:hypothetical protein